jgi:hypothetical protein
MVGSKWSRAAAWSLSFALALAAQPRLQEPLPCSGVVVDANGATIAGLAVHCDWRPKAAPN